MGNPQPSPSDETRLSAGGSWALVPQGRGGGAGWQWGLRDQAAGESLGRGEGLCCSDHPPDGREVCRLRIPAHTPREFPPLGGSQPDPPPRSLRRSLPPAITPRVSALDRGGVPVQGRGGPVPSHRPHHPLEQGHLPCPGAPTQSFILTSALEVPSSLFVCSSVFFPSHQVFLIRSHASKF